MFSKINQNDSERAISPVVGVILLVAVTVALVALASVIVFDLGSDISESADATVSVDDVGDNEVEVEIIRNENVEEFTIEGVDDEDPTMSDDVGQSERFDIDDDTVTVVGELEDGNEEVIVSNDVDHDA